MLNQEQDAFSNAAASPDASASPAVPASASPAVSANTESAARNGHPGSYTVRKCQLDHHNPPDFPVCRICGGILGEPQQVPVLHVGWMRGTDGQSRPLEGDIVVGRAPESAAFPGASLLDTPPLILPISRQHLLVRVQGWEVCVQDLGSNNGSWLHRANGQVVELEARKFYNVQPGDTVELAPEYSLSFEA